MAYEIINSYNSSWAVGNDNNRWVNFTSAPFAIVGATNGGYLHSVTLHCVRFINPDRNVTADNGPVAAGAVNTTGTVYLKLRMYDNADIVSDTIVLPDSPLWYLRGDGTASGTWPSSSRYGGRDTDIDESYTFTFTDPAVITNSNAVFLLQMMREKGSDYYGVGCRERYKSAGNIYGSAEVSEVPPGPTSITVTPTVTNGNWITDLTGVQRNSSQGVLKDYQTQYVITPNPSNAQITEANITGADYVSSAFNTNSKIITVTAINRNTDYPTVDTLNVNVNGGANTTFDVNFYEKPKATLSGNNSLQLNIRTAGSQGYTLSGYNLSTINTASDRALFLDNVYQSSFSPQNSNTLLNAGRYLTTASNSSNLFKISDEGIRHNLKWRFFNHFVQTNTSTVGTYKVDLDTYVTWYITPTMIQQFSFDWLDKNNNIISNPPEIMLPDFDLPVIGNLKYTNTAIQGGYCRGFRIEYINESNSVVYTDYQNATINSDGLAFTSGQIITKQKLNNLPYGQLLTVRITMYFYFDDSTTTRYYGASYTLDQKLLRLREEDLYPELIFPICNVQSPYTLMLLEESERFGYEISDILIEYSELFVPTFGITVGDKEMNFSLTPDYISSNKLTQHIVYNVGKFVEDNQLYQAELPILPYIDIFTGTEYAKRITINGTNTTYPNVIINTSEDTLWRRPTVDKGEVVTYFDYDRFIQFINKYKTLNNNELIDIPSEMRGNIIYVDFWVDVSNKLNIYSSNMQDWATDVTNYPVLWSLTEFTKQKGELITNNNLYQNFYDLLVQLSAFDNYATHDYLAESGYTHDFLHNYTHVQITNRDGL